jgi:hypothetical protein
MDDIDWRTKVTVTVTADSRLPSGQIAIAGSLLTVVTIIDIPKKKKLTLPLPDVTALYISQSKKMWDQYSDLRNQSKIDRTTQKEIAFVSDAAAFNAVEYIAASTIMAYSAIESFCNDSIPCEHEYWHNRNSQLILERSTKETIERRFSTAEKLNDILPAIHGVASPKGNSPVWTSFLELKECRDGLIHPKTHEVRPLFESNSSIWNKLFKLRKPYVLARDVFDWYLSDKDQKPNWYSRYPE